MDSSSSDPDVDTFELDERIWRFLDDLPDGEVTEELTPIVNAIRQLRRSGGIENLSEVARRRTRLSLAYNLLQELARKNAVTDYAALVRHTMSTDMYRTAARRIKKFYTELNHKGDEIMKEAEKHILATISINQSRGSGVSGSPSSGIGANVGGDNVPGRRASETPGTARNISDVSGRVSAVRDAQLYPADTGVAIPEPSPHIVAEETNLEIPMSEGLLIPETPASALSAHSIPAIPAPGDTPTRNVAGHRPAVFTAVTSEEPREEEQPAMMPDPVIELGSTNTIQAVGIPPASIVPDLLNIAPPSPDIAGTSLAPDSVSIGDVPRSSLALDAFASLGSDLRRETVVAEPGRASIAPTALNVQEQSTTSILDDVPPVPPPPEPVVDAPTPGPEHEQVLPNVAGDASTSANPADLTLEEHRVRGGRGTAIRPLLVDVPITPPVAPNPNNTPDSDVIDLAALIPSQIPVPTRGRRVYPAGLIIDQQIAIPDYQMRYTTWRPRDRLGAVGLRLINRTDEVLPTELPRLLSTPGRSLNNLASGRALSRLYTRHLQVETRPAESTTVDRTRRTPLEPTAPASTPVQPPATVTTPERAAGLPAAGGQVTDTVVEPQQQPEILPAPLPQPGNPIDDVQQPGVANVSPQPHPETSRAEEVRGAEAHEAETVRLGGTLPPATLNTDNVPQPAVPADGPIVEPVGPEGIPTIQDILDILQDAGDAIGPQPSVEEMIVQPILMDSVLAAVQQGQVSAPTVAGMDHPTDDPTNNTTGFVGPQPQAENIIVQPIPMDVTPGPVQEDMGQPTDPRGVGIIGVADAAQEAPVAIPAMDQPTNARVIDVWADTSIFADLFDQRIPEGAVNIQDVPIVGADQLLPQQPIHQPNEEINPVVPAPMEIQVDNQQEAALPTIGDQLLPQQIHQLNVDINPIPMEFETDNQRGAAPPTADGQLLQQEIHQPEASVHPTPMEIDAQPEEEPVPPAMEDQQGAAPRNELPRQQVEGTRTGSLNSIRLVDAATLMEEPRSFSAPPVVTAASPRATDTTWIPREEFNIIGHVLTKLRQVWATQPAAMMSDIVDERSNRAEHIAVLSCLVKLNAQWIVRFVQHDDTWAFQQFPRAAREYEATMAENA